MSSENVDTVRRGFEVLREQGLEAMLEFVDPEFEVTTPPEFAVEPSTYRGHDGLRRYFDSFYEVMEEVRFEPEEFIAAGEQVVVPLRLVARGRGTGIEADQRLVQVCTLRDGKILRMDLYATTEEALAATRRRVSGASAPRTPPR
jgi:ketosteroid isomerase-like protein